MRDEHRILHRVPVAGLMPPRACIGISGNPALHLGDEKRQSETIKKDKELFPLPQSPRRLLERGHRVLDVPGEDLGDGVKVGDADWAGVCAQSCSPHFSRNLSINRSASALLILTSSAPELPYSHWVTAD